MIQAKDVWLKIIKSKTQQVMSITTVGMGFMLILDILIAARFGTTEVADSLIIALLLPMFLDTVFRESTKYSLVPVFIQYKAEHELTVYNRFISGLMNLLLIVTLILSGIIFFLSPFIISLIGPGLSEEAVNTSSSILKALIPLIIVLPIISVLGVNLNSIKNFNSVALRNLIIPIVVISSMVIGWNSDITHIYAALGYSLGFALYGVVLWGVSTKSGYQHHLGSLSGKYDIKKIRSAITWPTLGFIIRQGGRVAEKSIASLIGIGGVAGYYYGYRFLSALQTIIGTSIATITLPDLTGKNNLEDYKNLLIKSLRTVLILTVPIALIVSIFSEQIIQIVFARGYFDTTSIERTSIVLFWLSFGIIFTCMIPVLNSSLYAKKRFKTVFLNMVFLTIFNVTTGYIFAKYWGLAGLAISVSLTALVSFGILLLLNFRNNSENSNG